MVVDAEVPMSTWRRGALGVANSREDSSTGGGGCERGGGRSCSVRLGVRGIQIRERELLSGGLGWTSGEGR